MLDAAGVDHFSIVASLHGVPAARDRGDATPIGSRSWSSSAATSRLFCGPDYPDGIDPADPRSVPRDVHAVVGHRDRRARRSTGSSPTSTSCRSTRVSSAPRQHRDRSSALLRWITSTRRPSSASAGAHTGAVFGIPTRLVPIEATRVAGRAAARRAVPRDSATIRCTTRRRPRRDRGRDRRVPHRLTRDRARRPHRSPRCCSPTSSGRPSAPQSSATTSGATSWRVPADGATRARPLRRPRGEQPR